MFLQLHKPPVLIDEVQYAPELFTYIKIHIDEYHNPGDFWMTGSQFPPHAGRARILSRPCGTSAHVPHVAAGKSSAPLRALYDRYGSIASRARSISARNHAGAVRPPVAWLHAGLISGQSPDRNIFYSSYLSTYVERDVRELSGSVDALKFNRFVTAVAARCSQLLNYKALADDADIDMPTAKNWVNTLETLGIIFLLHPYSNNVLKRTIKTPKVYFYDTGLVCYLTRWSSPEVAESGAMSGALLENFTVSEIMKSYQNAGLEPYLYFYRDRDAKEIDVILEGDGKLCPLRSKRPLRPISV